jgi:hypothetical protein
MFFGSGDGSPRTADNGDADSRICKFSVLLNLNLDHSNGNGLDEYKDAAAKIAVKVTEQASYLKGKALDWLS